MWCDNGRGRRRRNENFCGRPGATSTHATLALCVLVWRKGAKSFDGRNKRPQIGDRGEWVLEMILVAAVVVVIVEENAKIR